MDSIAQKIEIDFTDEGITSSGGSIFLSRMARRLGIPGLIKDAIRLKSRRRGADDVQTMMSMIYCLAQGDGKLLDVDRLAADETRQQLLGLGDVPGHRRLGEYLFRFDDYWVNRFLGVAHEVAGRVSGEIIEHYLNADGYIPVFVDGSAIEVSGNNFEFAGVGYNNERQYWLHTVFIARLWASCRLFPGGVDVAQGWREQLDETADLIGQKGPVWLRADNAYYRGDVVRYCRDKGWDFSISVTNDTYKKPLREIVSAWWEEDWTPINNGKEDATFVYHRPAGWKRDEAYAVIRSYWDGPQKLLTPRYTFILVSRDDLPLEELVKRHRGKQGQENALKGPLIDLDLHHPPSSRFNANRAFYIAGQIAQMLLCAVQFKLLPEKAREHAIRTIIRDLVRTAAKLVRHAHRLKLLFAKTSLKLDWIAYAADQMELLTHPPPA